MTTSVTFETATLADAIKKAARVAPSKSGHAFDKAAGIVLDIFPGQEVQCVVRATNTDVFSAEVIAVVEATGPEVRWRMSSMLLASVIGTLPITNGKVVKLTQDKSQIKMESGRTKATMIQMDPTYYPEWDSFDPDGMTTVNGLGGRLEQVEWAASTAPTPPLCGIYLDGDFAIATDRYRLARVPCRIDLPRPIIIPAGILGSVLRPMGDVGVSVRGSTLEIAVDGYHQVQTIIYEMEFPPVGKVMKTDHPAKVEVTKSAFIDMVGRANAFAGSDRAPLLRMYFGREEIAVMMTNDEVGLLGDVIEVPGQIGHPRTELRFTPKNVLDAVGKAPGSKITLGYNPENQRVPLYVSDGSGYEAWVVPRAELKAEM
jgi:DNA polymerase III sliding clamp (beta) subunit (PCNA family)